MKISRRQFLGLTGALALTSCARVKVPYITKAEPKPFTVAALNDLHILDARSTAILARAVQQINDTPNLRCSIVIGDLSTGGQLGEFNLAKKTLARLQKPCLALPGNHDVNARERAQYANFDRFFAPHEWVHEEGDWVFLGLNSCDGNSSDVTLPKDRIDWIKKSLRHIDRKRPLALFCHHPLGPRATKYRIKNADEVLALFSEHTLKLAASGHWHGNQEAVENGVLFTTTACCSSTRPNFDDSPAKGYRLFHFDDAKLTTEFVEVKI